MASSEASSAEEAIKEVTQRHLAVNFAGVLATARERGVEPEHADLVEKAKLLATVNAKMNTDFHYAYELVNILERISHRTFVFDAPPIIGRADPQTMDLLQEATRCYPVRTSSGLRDRLPDGTGRLPKATSTPAEPARRGDAEW